MNVQKTSGLTHSDRGETVGRFSNFIQELIQMFLSLSIKRIWWWHHHQGENELEGSRHRTSRRFELCIRLDISDWYWCRDASLVQWQPSPHTTRRCWRLWKPGNYKHTRRCRLGSSGTLLHTVIWTVVDSNYFKNEEAAKRRMEKRIFLVKISMTPNTLPNKQWPVRWNILGEIGPRSDPSATTPQDGGLCCHERKKNYSWERRCHARGLLRWAALPFRRYVVSPRTMSRVCYHRRKGSEHWISGWHFSRGAPGTPFWLTRQGACCRHSGKKWREVVYTGQIHRGFQINLVILISTLIIHLQICLIMDIYWTSLFKLNSAMEGPPKAQFDLCEASGIPLDGVFPSMFIAQQDFC